MSDSKEEEKTTRQKRKKKRNIRTATLNGRSCKVNVEETTIERIKIEESEPKRKERGVRLSEKGKKESARKTHKRDEGGGTDWKEGGEG